MITSREEQNAHKMGIERVWMNQKKNGYIDVLFQ